MSNFFFLYQNDAEFLEANFVYHENDGQPLVSGSVNWAKEGRSFKIEPCNKFVSDEKDCFVWSEVDTGHWYESS